MVENTDERQEIKKPFNLEGLFGSVIPIGFEPMAYCLEGSCSIQLSYGTSIFNDVPKIDKHQILFQLTIFQMAIPTLGRDALSIHLRRIRNQYFISINNFPDGLPDFRSGCSIHLFWKCQPLDKKKAN